MEKQTYTVKYTGNEIEEIQTAKWIGSIFLVTERENSWEAIKILHNAKGFDIDGYQLPSFYKFNAKIIGYSTGGLEDNLFEIE